MTKVKIATIDVWECDVKFGVSLLPSEIMQNLGVTYDLKRHHGMNETTYFYNPQNIPKDLPEYVRISFMDKEDAVFLGLCK